MGQKEINQAVKNNAKKFPSRYCFRIDEDEYKVLKSKFLTSKGGSRKGHNVFTEQGVAMLATVLRTKVATEVSIQIMDAFVKMRHYIGNNEYRLSNVESKVIEHDKKIELLNETFKKFEEKRKINEIYFKGEIYDAYSKIVDIFNEAKYELIIIDSYADKTILDMINSLSVKVILITSDKSKLKKIDIDKYNIEYDNLNVIYNNDFHDRYFIIDRKVIYHCGTSINNAGSKTFCINILDDDMVKVNLIKYINNILSIKSV